MGGFAAVEDEEEPAHRVLGDLPEDVLPLIVQAAGGNGENLHPPAVGLDHLLGVVVVLSVVQMRRRVGYQNDQPDRVVKPPVWPMDCHVERFVERLRGVAAVGGDHVLNGAQEGRDIGVEVVEPRDEFVAPVAGR